MTKRSVVGLILAGGKSSRMGRDKATIQVGHQTMLQQAQQLLHEAGCEELFVSSNQLPNAICDNIRDIGPVAGIEAGMKYLLAAGHRGYCMVLPVDMFLMRSKSLQMLLEQIDAHDISYYERHPLPLVIRLDQTLYHKVASLAQAAMNVGGISIKALFNELKSITIAPTEIQEREFFNCNSPDELQQLKSSLK